MRELEAKLFIRFIPSALSCIQVHYSVSVPLQMLNGSLTLKLNIGNLIESDFTIDQQKGFLAVPVDELEFQQEIIPVWIKTNKLWIPDLLVYNKDVRLQGIAIEKIEYLEE